MLDGPMTSAKKQKVILKGFDNWSGRGSYTKYLASNLNSKGRSRERSDDRKVWERSQTGTQSPRMKRARHNSKRSRSGNSARSVEVSGSVEVRLKEVVLISVRTPTRKEIRKHH
jgi:hypothetical protein